MHYMHYMHYKDYIHHDFYVYSTSAAHAVPWTLLAHSLHWAIYFAYIGLAAEKTPPPLPQGGGGTIWLGEGGGVWGSLLIYTHATIVN